MSRTHKRCSVVDCTDQSRSLFQLPASEDRRTEWIKFIFGGDAPAKKDKNILVCAKHFEQDCFYNHGQYSAGLAIKLRLRDGATPTLRGGSGGEAAVKPLLQEQEEIKARDELMKVKERLLKLENELVEVKRKHRQLKASRRAKTKPPRQDGSVEYQVDVPETSTTAVEKPDLQYVVDEEAILQLMKNCPVCNRKCRCSKYTHGSYFIVNQSCYSCHYRRKWASQPGASAIRRPSRRAKVRA
ncbi:uncharacterized protein [Brachionichthys hirsutus]|uniref:uncharacterized protein isoform X2 n=1 Tax=Brachionichthys hirsutus TaxID=412623 RepID=UPI0036043888